MAGALGEEVAAFARSVLKDSAARAQEFTQASSLPQYVEIYSRQIQDVTEALMKHNARMRDIVLAALGSKNR